MMSQLARRCGTKAVARHQFVPLAGGQTHPCRQQVRALAMGWVEFVEQRFNPKTQAYKSEDPEQTARRLQEEVDSKGRTLLSLPKNQKSARHVKPTTYRKELKNRVAYERKRQEVMDLIKYIQFVKDHKDKVNW